MVMLMWALEIADQVGGLGLDAYGIHPRDPDSLTGVATAPFLHGGFGHLLGNTVPFVILGAVIAIGGLVRVLAATVIIALVAGLGTWLFGPADTVHIGASGLVMGYATYLITSGIVSRSLLSLAVGLVVLAVFGPTLLTSLIPEQGVSWQSHLFGALGGVLAAFVLERRPDDAPAPG